MPIETSLEPHSRTVQRSTSLHSNENWSEMSSDTRSVMMDYSACLKEIEELGKRMTPREQRELKELKASPSSQSRLWAGHSWMSSSAQLVARWCSQWIAKHNKYSAHGAWADLCQIVLGAYLFVHFGQLIEYAPAIWSRHGMIPNAKSLPTYSWLNPLMLIDTPLVCSCLLSLLCLVAGLFAAIALVQWPYFDYDQKSRSTRGMALLMVVGWAWLLQRNPLINNPGLPYIGLILVAYALGLMDATVAISTRQKARWVIFWALALGYTVSGVRKVQNSPSWARTHDALELLLDNPLARTGLARDLIKWLVPKTGLRWMTSIALDLEVINAPAHVMIWLATRGRRRGQPGQGATSGAHWLTRSLALAMISMHIGIVMLINFTDLTLGMLTVHWVVWM